MDINNAVDGDTITLAEGQYQISDLIGLSNANKAVTISAETNATVILNAADGIALHGAKTCRSFVARVPKYASLLFHGNLRHLGNPRRPVRLTGEDGMLSRPLDRLASKIISAKDGRSVWRAVSGIPSGDRF